MEERSLSAPPPMEHGTNSKLEGQSAQGRPNPQSLRKALLASGRGSYGSAADSETPSEEDYDDNVQTGGVRKRRDTPRRQQRTDSESNEIQSPSSDGRAFRDEAEGLQEVLEKTTQHIKDSRAAGRRTKFRDLVFTHQFSAFDPSNEASANSPFHGFYNLFWLTVALFMLKISVLNWREHGNPLGPNDIMKTMFHRDVVVLLLSDGAMCGITGVSWLIQLIVFKGYLDWNSGGWVLQNIWQATFFAGIIGLTLVREWPWMHTVFFVLHGMVMVMKQHSYAFYNGHLSTVHAKRLSMLAKLKQLERVDQTSGPSLSGPPLSDISTKHLEAPPSVEQRRLSMSQTDNDDESDIDRISKAIASGKPLDTDQIQLFERLLKWETQALTDELTGTAKTPDRAYPSNLTFANHYKWIPLPTLVYELDYPWSDSIRWSYVAEKLTAMVGLLFVMMQISQTYIYPVVMKTLEMKEIGMPLTDRFKEFPWLLADLIFPFMMEYLLVWYLIWETILNILAELTFFADRSFYEAWWNSVSWDQFARDWNRPVHVFLLRHVYHSSISFMKVDKHTATLITFFLSACVHELLMWCLFKKLRGYLLFMQMCQLPLVRLSRTKWLRGRKTLGNLIFWLGIFTGPSLLCSLYLIL